MIQIRHCLYMMLSNRTFPVLVLCGFVFMACHGRLTKNVNSMMHKKVLLDTVDMEVINPRRNVYISNDSDKAFTLIVYNDESECISCNVNNLNEWHRFLTQVYSGNNGVKVCFIFSPENESANNIRVLLQKQSFGHPVFLDSAHVFEKANPWIPKESIYHTFLLDNNNKIVLIGNPLQNQKINQLFFEVISKRHY